VRTVRRLAAALARQVLNGLVVYGTSLSCAAGRANPPRDKQGADRQPTLLTDDESRRFAAIMAQYDSDGDAGSAGH
jgi:hypothetical protein